MTLPKHVQFLADLEGFLRAFKYVGTGAAATTGISANLKLNADTAKRQLVDYRYDILDKNWNGARPTGYLASYVKTFGPKFSYERLQFDGGFMHVDQAVMKVMLHFACVSVTTDGHFLLTAKGEALIAPFHLVDSKEMEAAYAGR